MYNSTSFDYSLPFTGERKQIEALGERMDSRAVASHRREPVELQLDPLLLKVLLGNIEIFIQCWDKVVYLLANVQQGVDLKRVRLENAMCNSKRCEVAGTASSN